MGTGRRRQAQAREEEEGAAVRTEGPPGERPQQGRHDGLRRGPARTHGRRIESGRQLGRPRLLHPRSQEPRLAAAEPAVAATSGAVGGASARPGVQRGTDAGGHAATRGVDARRLPAGRAAQPRHGREPRDGRAAAGRDAETHRDEPNDHGRRRRHRLHVDLRTPASRLAASSPTSRRRPSSRCRPSHRPCSTRCRRRSPRQRASRPRRPSASSWAAKSTRSCRSSRIRTRRPWRPTAPRRSKARSCGAATRCGTSRSCGAPPGCRSGTRPSRCAWSRPGTRRSTRHSPPTIKASSASQRAKAQRAWCGPASNSACREPPRSARSTPCRSCR